MAERKLSPEEVKSLGLEAPARKLAPEEVSALGLEAPAATGPSAPAAAGRGFVQGGTMGFGDELAGAGQAGLQFLATHPTIQRIVTAPLYGQLFTPEKDLLLQPNTDASGEAPVGAGDAYRTARDAARGENEKAAKAHPLAYAGGNIAGAIATAKPLGALAGAVPGLQGTRAARILKQGTALGALASLGNSNASEPGQLAADTVGVTGAQQALDDVGDGKYVQGALDLLGAGGLGGLTAGVGAEVAPFLFRGFGSRLENQGIKTAKRSIYNVTNGLSPRKELADTAAREALEIGAVRPLGTAHGTAERLGEVARMEGERLDNAIKTLEAAGVRVPADPIVAELGAAEAAARQNSLGAKVPNVFRRGASDIIDVTGTDSALGLGQTENLKRSAQEEAQSAYRQNRPAAVGRAKKVLAATLRRASEDAAAKAKLGAVAGDPVDMAADDFIEAKQRLADLLPARNEAEIGAARGGRRSALGLAGHELVAEGLASGDPAKATTNLVAAIANSLIHHVGPSTAASSLYFGGKAMRQGARALDTPTMRMLITALQRAKETARPEPIRRDEQGRPILTIHTGP